MAMAAAQSIRKQQEGSSHGIQVPVARHVAAAGLLYSNNPAAIPPQHPDMLGL